MKSMTFEFPELGASDLIVHLFYFFFSRRINVPGLIKASLRYSLEHHTTEDYIRKVKNRCVFIYELSEINHAIIYHLLNIEQTPSSRSDQFA